MSKRSTVWLGVNRSAIIFLVFMVAHSAWNHCPVVAAMWGVLVIMNAACYWRKPWRD